ncbi:CPBP family intramembrane glutamic endopeptidase [Frigidibacter sp. MR17.14]|uniref:CPBP family intramembrane glutamic endopeptidase n=1 Tax=Frigidibacter sp. MR17.14 TaxID=3126509 RepID=UPI003012F039
MRRLRGGPVSAFATFLAWLLVMLLAGPNPGEPVPISAMVTEGIALQLLLAPLFLILVTRVIDFGDLGLRAPALRHLRLLWLPLLYVAAIFAFAVALGLPTGRQVLFVLANCVLVGISEELMFRGVLFAGFRRRFSPWPAVVAVTLLFGSVHILNAFITGSLTGAVMQAAAAGLSGLLFIALRVRTGSLILCIALHALWNFAAFMATLAQGDIDPGQVADLPLVAQLMPALFVLPLFLYALYLLRDLTRRLGPGPATPGTTSA